MIVISNNVKKLGLDFPKGATIRINVAWVKSLEELETIIQENKDFDVWVDYPTGRTKPPIPVLSIAEVISVLHKYFNVKYFAFSNAEDKNIVQLIRQAVPKNIQLIPKIETELGVYNVKEIVQAAQAFKIMLDMEDLYTNVKNDIHKCQTLATLLKTTCDNMSIQVLSLKGVIFA